MYCGIRNKTDHTAKRPHLSPTTELIADLEYELKHERHIKQDLDLHLQHEKQIRQDLELQLHREKQVKQDMEHQLQHQMQQIQPIPWDRVGAEIDSELANLQQVVGALTIG